MVACNSVVLYVNGCRCEVQNVDARTTLATYLRDVCALRAFVSCGTLSLNLFSTSYGHETELRGGHVRQLHGGGGEVRCATQEASVCLRLGDAF